METPEIKPKDKAALKVKAKRAFFVAFKTVVGIFAAFHIYVLYLSLFPAPTTATIVQRKLAGESIQRDVLKLYDISPNLIAAVIAAEDGQFCTHHGIEFAAIEKAMDYNVKGGRRRGGSTITQQTAKNLFL